VFVTYALLIVYVSLSHNGPAMTTHGSVDASCLEIIILNSHTATPQTVLSDLGHVAGSAGKQAAFKPKNGLFVQKFVQMAKDTMATSHNWPRATSR
jgi:hypothetical protein